MNGRERRNRGRYSEWPHMTTLYNSNSRIHEAGKSNDVPLSTIENSFEPPNSHGYFRYNGQRNDTLDSVISEGISSRPPSFKYEEDERVSSYELGDKFKRGSTCRVILCIFFVLCFIGVVIAGVVLSVLLSQRILPKKVSKTFESSATLNNATFTEALTDVNSPQFHKLATDFCEAMKAMFTTSSSPFSDDYEDCEVLSFSPGSVKVRFRLGSKIYSEVNMETILGQLKNHLQNMITREGPWNPLRIDETTILNFKEVDPKYRIKYSSQFKMTTKETSTENLSSKYIQSSLKEKETMSSKNIIESTEIKPSSSRDNLSSLKDREIMSSQRITESTEIEPFLSLDDLSSVKDKEIMFSQRVIELTETEQSSSLDNLSSLREKEIMSSQSTIESTETEPYSSRDNLSSLKDKEIMSSQRIIESIETETSSSLDNWSSFKDKEIMSSQRIIESTETQQSSSRGNLSSFKKEEIMSSQNIIEATEIKPSSSRDNLSSLKDKEIMSSQRIIESTETEPSSSRDNLSSLKDKEIMSSQRIIESTETEPSSSRDNLSSLKDKEIMSSPRIIESTETEQSSSLDIFSSLKEKDIMSSQRIIESTETEQSSSLDNLSTLKDKEIMSSPRIIESTVTEQSSPLDNLSSLKDKEIMSSQRIIESTETELFSSLDNLSEELKQITSLNQISLSILDTTGDYERYITENVEPKTDIPSSSVLNSLVSSFTDYEITPSIPEEVFKRTVHLFNDEMSKSKIKTGLTMLYSTELSTRRFKMSHETTNSDTIRTSIVLDKLSNDFLHTEKYQLAYMEFETNSLNSSDVTKLYITPDMVVTSTLMVTSDSSVFSMLPKDFRKIDASQVYVDTSSKRDQSTVGLEDLNIFSTKYAISFSGSGHSDDIMSTTTSQVTETVNNNIQVYSNNVARTFTQTRPHVQYHTTTEMFSRGSSQLPMLSSLSLLNTPVNVNTSDNFDFISSKLTLDGDEFRKASVSSTKISPDKTMSLKADKSMYKVVSIEKSVSSTVDPSSVEELTSSLPEFITNSTSKYLSQSALPLYKTSRYLSTTSSFTDSSSPLTALASSDIYASVSTTRNLETTFVKMNQQRSKTDKVTKMERTFEQTSMPYVGTMTEIAGTTSEFSFDESTYLNYIQQAVNETSIVIAFKSSNEYKQDSSMRSSELAAETETTKSFSDKDISYSTRELRPLSSAEVAEESYVYVSPDTSLSEYGISIAIDTLYSSHPDPSSDHQYLQSSIRMFSTKSGKSFKLVPQISSEIQFSSSISTFSIEYSDVSDIVRNIGPSIISNATDPYISVTEKSSISNYLDIIRPNLTKSPITGKPDVTKLKPEIENEIFINETWIQIPVDDSYSSKLIITPQKEQMISSQIISKQLDTISSRESESQHSLISFDNQHTKYLTFDSTDSSAATENIFNSHIQSQVQEHISFVDSVETSAVESSILLEQNYNTNTYIKPTIVLKPTASVDKLFATQNVILENLNSNSTTLFLSRTRPVPDVDRTTDVIASYIEELSSVVKLKTSTDSADFTFMTSYTDILPQQESGIIENFESSSLSTEINALVLIDRAENNTSNLFTSNSLIYTSSTASTFSTAGSLLRPMPPMTVLAEIISNESVLIDHVDISLFSTVYVTSKAVNAHSPVDNMESSNTHSAAVYSSLTNPEKSSLLFVDILSSESNNLKPVVFTPSFYISSNDLYTTFSINEDMEIVDISSSSLIENEKLETKFQTSVMTFTPTSLLQNTLQTGYATDQLFPSEPFTVSQVFDNNMKATPTITGTIYAEKDFESDFDYVETTSKTLVNEQSIKKGNQTTKLVLKTTQLDVRANESSNFIVASQYNNIPSIRSYMISSSDFPSEPLSMTNSIDQRIEGTIVSKIQMSPDKRYFSSITKDNVSHIPTDYYNYSHDAMASSSITSNMQLSINGNKSNNTPFEQTLNEESITLPYDAFPSSVQKEETFKTEFNEINMNLITPSQIQNVQENSLSLSSVFAVNVENQIQQKLPTAPYFISAIRTSDVVLSNDINMYTASIPQLTFKSISAIDINISSSKLANNGIISPKTSTQDVVTSSIINIPDILSNAFYNTHSSLSTTYLSSITREIIQIMNHSSTSKIQENMVKDISLINSTFSAKKSEQKNITPSAGNFLFSKSEESNFFKISSTQPASHIVINNILSNLSALQQRVVDVVATKLTDVNDTDWINDELSPSSTTTKSSLGYLSTYVHKINKTMVVDGSENTNAELSDEVLSSAKQSDLEKNKTLAISSKTITTEILKTSFISIPDISLTETVDNFISTSSLDISVTNLHLSTLFFTSAELDTSEYYNQGSYIYASQSIPSFSVLSSAQVQDNIPDIFRFLDTTP
ncbi:serine-rich adhesin for platelets-like [Mytilus edulis]|uniref:serine-rich adhesin for platelets-like n=1 Tax=Mytilus edulis TaxID=6550 RepID=UPI0039EE4910